MGISTIASGIFAVVKAIPAAKSIFFEVQDMYYDMIYASLNASIQEKKGKRRALSNSIENANSDEDRKYLSIMLHEYNSGVSNDGREPSSGKTETT